MPERTVRVRCDMDGQHETLPGHFYGRGMKCGGVGDERGTFFATLSDPEAEALIADGERYRAGNVRQRGPDNEGGKDG